MTKQMLACVSLLSLAFAGYASAAAPEYGTLAEAKAMLTRAVAAMKTNQLDAIARFNHNDPEFRDRDLFVFCFDGGNGKFTAHEALVTYDVREFRDSIGAPVGEDMYNTAQQGRISEVVYIAPLPGSTELAMKSAYVTRIRDQVCGVSAYQVDGLTKSVKMAQPQRW